MGFGILAPVPADLLKSALATCEEKGRVAFGTNAGDIFRKAAQVYGQPFPILIYPTIHYGDPDRVSAPGYACFRGAYLRLAPANPNGRHPEASIRPPTTISGSNPDTPWQYFWEVESLKMLPKAQHVAITTLTAEGQRKPLPKGYVPHGPLIVEAIFL